MAFTVSQLVNTVIGNQRKVSYRITADAATQTIDTALNNIEDFSVSLQSASTAAMKWGMNEGSTGTAIAGNLAVSGAVSGDEYIVIVCGK